MAHLFISYASDDQTIAMEVCALLEAQGVSCWIAPRDVAAGKVWDEAILDAIEGASAFLLILSSSANASAFVKNEVNRAFSLNKPIVTFRVEDVMPGRSLELYLARHHWTDGFTGRIEHQVAELASSVTSLVGASVLPGGAVGVAAPPKARKSAPARMVTRATRRERIAWAVTGAALIGMATLGVPAMRHLREVAPSARSETRTSIVTPSSQIPMALAISPDGTQMIFVASGDGPSRLWLRKLAETEAQPLSGTEGVLNAFWSPDSRSIGFFANEQLKRLDLAGGVVQPLAPAPDGRGGTWNSDGVILFAESAVGPLLRVSASGGTTAKVTTLQRGQNAHRFPSFLADGRHYLFYAVGEVQAAGIYLGSLDSMDATRITASDTAALALPSDWLLWMSDSTLLAQHLDVDHGALTGEPVRLAEPVEFSAGLYLGGFSVSKTGLIAYRASAEPLSQLTWVDRSGKVLGTLGEPSNQSDMRIAPDGRRVAVSRSVQGNSDVWILDDLRTSRLTFDPGRDAAPVWSPDGSRIAFASTRSGPTNIYVKGVGGTGTETRVIESPTTNQPDDWSQDGRVIVYQNVAGSTRRDVLGVTMAGTPAAAAQSRDIVKTPFNDLYGRVSPDGRWLAYTSNETGRYEIYVRPFDTQATQGSAQVPDGTQWQISTAGGKLPTWRGDGREIYYLGFGENAPVMAVPVTPRGASLEPGTPVTLFRSGMFVSTDLNDRRAYDVSRDGRILLNVPVGATNLQPITLIQNWAPPN